MMSQGWFVFCGQHSPADLLLYHLLYVITTVSYVLTTAELQNRPGSNVHFPG